MSTSTSVSAEQANTLRRRLEAAVNSGVLRRGEERNEYLVWRYDGIGFEYCIKCYSGKRGLKIVDSDARIRRILATGDSDAIRGLVDDSTRGSGVSGTVVPLPPAGPAGATVPPTSKPIELGDLSQDQLRVFRQIQAWLERGDRAVLRLGGYAGTGKSTLIGLLARETCARRSVGFCAYTGKAANVLRSKLVDANVSLERHSCGTIHSLLYEPITDPETGSVIEWKKRRRIPHELIVVDEASMVTTGLLEDLLSHRVPILAVGDHGQLPPVGEDDGIMAAPDLRLETVHRQARDNPIIDLSVRIRAGEDPLAAPSAEGPIRRLRGRAELNRLIEELFDSPGAADSTVLLCYRNRTRVGLNGRVRSQLGLDAAVLSPEDRVICLRNHRLGGILVANGMRGFVEHVSDGGAERGDDHRIRAGIRFEAQQFRLETAVSRYQFGRERRFESYQELPFPAGAWSDVGLLFDYGYALTVHKAQGSQFRRVIVCVERVPRRDDFQRWLYTAVTRAVEEVVLFEE